MARGEKVCTFLRTCTTRDAIECDSAQVKEKQVFFLLCNKSLEAECSKSLKQRDTDAAFAIALKVVQFCFCAKRKSKPN